MVKTEEVKPIAFFEPTEWQIPALNDKNDIMLLSGSAGGGKSRLAAEKIHAFLLHYPGASAVVCRKKREDMNKSTVPLMLETVIDIKHEPRCQYKARLDRVIYDHGDKPDSELIFTGIHNKVQREGLKSIGKDGGIDIFWMEEATEFDEDDFNVVGSRVRGDAAGWNQIILTTNPGPRLHWINRRLIISEEAAYYPSHALDNPYVPLTYQDRLASLTGVQGQRLREGVWTDGEGVVVDTWLDDHSGKTSRKTSGNVTLDAEYIPGYGPIMWYVDDGYAGEFDSKTGWFTERSNPRTFLIAQERRNGTIAILGEHLEVQMLPDAHIQKVLMMCSKYGWPNPKKVIYDGAAPSLGGEIKRAGLKTKPVRCKIEDGLDELRAWIGKDKNGIRRIIVHPRCKFLRWEMGSYTYNDDGIPIDAFNHTIDGLRYGVWYKSHGPSQRTHSMAIGVDREAIDNKVAEVMMKVRERYEATDSAWR